MACPRLRRDDPMGCYRSTLLAVCASLVAGGAAAETTVTIIDDVPGAGRLAAPATGQTLYILDETARRVTAVDPFAPAKRWQALGPSDLDADGPEAVQPLAVACIDSNTLAVVCRAAAGWSLRAFRLAPPSSQEAATLAQSIPLGPSTGADAPVDVFVSDTRDWLAVVGLPAPLPRVLRAPIAGSRLGAFSERLCPPASPQELIMAALSSPFDEWVLFTRRAEAASDRTLLTFLANSGRRRLLELTIPLAGIRDAAFCRGSGTLWVAADGAEEEAVQAGLWRIDAALEGGRQVAVPVAIAALPSPRSVVCLSERAIAVSGGGEQRRVILVNPTPTPTP